MKRIPQRSALAALCALACLAGCSSLGAREHNLNALHSADGHHNVRAALMGNIEWELRQGLAGLIPGRRATLTAKPARKVDDPVVTCLREVNRLARMGRGDETSEARRIVLLARFAVECPWKLSRERCALALGELGRGLDLAQHPPSLEGPDPIGPDALGALLTALLESIQPAVLGEVGSGDALRAACAALSSANYDLAGARRALSFLALVARTARSHAALSPLVDLRTELERITVHRALVAALADRTPFELGGSDPGWDSARVRGAALRGMVRAFGATALGEALTELDASADPELVVELFELVAENGLPRHVPGIESADEAKLHEHWLETLLNYATAYPEAAVRVSAMRALRRASGEAVTSLREEEWFAWYREHRRALESAAPPDGSAPASGSDDGSGASGEGPGGATGGGPGPAAETAGSLASNAASSPDRGPTDAAGCDPTVPTGTGTRAP